MRRKIQKIQIYSVADAAAILCASPAAIYALIRRGELPAARVAGRLQIASSDLANYARNAGAWWVVEEIEHHVIE